MDFVAQLVRISTVLAQAGHPASAHALEDCRLALGTLGEVLQSSCGVLLDLRKQLPDAYALVENEAEAVLAYAVRLHYLPPSATKRLVR